MSNTERHTHARKLVAFMRDEIPLAHTMDLSLQACDEQHLALAAPLGPNINDKGCAFGGSLVSVMTLNGWGLVELELRLRGLACDVFVGESTVRYLEPVWEDFTSEARLAASADWVTFFGRTTGASTNVVSPTKTKTAGVKPCPFATIAVAP